jgi:hypothetical protein
MPTFRVFLIAEDTIVPKDKIGRNDKCMCGSGKKFKYCHGAIENSSLAPHIDAPGITLYVPGRNMLMNRVEREAKVIAEGFDLLCHEHVAEIEQLYGPIAALLMAGSQYSEKSQDQIRIALYKVLTNALKSFTAAFSLLRSGWRLQPYQCIRNCMEALSVTLHLFMHSEDLGTFERDELQSTATFKSAKQLMPNFGRVYGILSEEYTHVGRPFRFVQSGIPYFKEEKDLWRSLGVLMSVLWLFYQVTELVFLDLAEPPLFWKEVNVGQYEFKPKRQAIEWQEKLARHFKEFMKEAEAK